MKKTYILTEEQLNLVVEIEKKLLIESDLNRKLPKAEPGSAEDYFFG